MLAQDFALEVRELNISLQYTEAKTGDYIATIRHATSPHLCLILSLIHLAKREGNEVGSRVRRKSTAKPARLLKV